MSQQTDAEENATPLENPLLGDKDLEEATRRLGEAIDRARRFFDRTDLEAVDMFLDTTPLRELEKEIRKLQELSVTEDPAAMAASAARVIQRLGTGKEVHWKIEVQSDSEPDTTYTIYYDTAHFGEIRHGVEEGETQDPRYSCTCPAFRFGSGTDEDGHCKHIRRLLSVHEDEVPPRAEILNI